MKTGAVLHHKYFNGVIPSDRASKYKDACLKYFSHFGMHGTGMFGMIAKGPDIEKDYDWRNTDLLIEYASENGIKIHFNTVMTGHLDVFPEWFKKLGAKEKISSLEKHVRAVINRYKGKVDFFKLVNEVVKEPEDNFLETGLGKAELISNIFKWAVDEYSEGRYMLNDYGSLIREEIRGPFLDLIDKVKELGGRIDIVGEQGHSGYHPRPFYLPPDDQLNDVLDEIHARTKLPLMITEFDLAPKNGDYPGGSIDPTKEVVCDDVSYSSWYEYQVYAYKHMKDLCENKVYVEGLYYWSFVDDSSITWERYGCGLLNEDMAAKEKMVPLLEELEKENL